MDVFIGLFFRTFIIREFVLIIVAVLYASSNILLYSSSILIYIMYRYIVMIMHIVCFREEGRGGGEGVVSDAKIGSQGSFE